MYRYLIMIALLTGLYLLNPVCNIYAQEKATTVRLDQVSDQQLADLLQQAKASGLSDEQFVEAAISRGLPATEAVRLRDRISRLNQRTSADTGVVRRRIARPADSLSNPQRQLRIGAPESLPVFGADLFANQDIRFEPNLNLATPVNYILGPGDQLNISVYGLSQANWKPEVSPEGAINIPGTGLISVSGKTISQATALIRSRLVASRYTLGNGTSLQVSLGNIRSIKVIMVGQLVRPGTYTLPSLATVFNALYSAGGPTVGGSLRKIEILRNSRVIRRLDVYDFLVSGDQRDNINLQDQDIVRVPTYTSRVELSGEIKIPAIFEVLPGEHLQKVIDFAGGFTDSAYVARVKVSQISNGHRRVTDILERDFTTYQPQRGDKYTVEAIVNRFDNRVVIRGAVFRPGTYELSNALTLSQLITKSEGLKEDAYLDRGTITRLNADNTTSLISFDIKKVMAGNSDITLQREDVVHVASLFDLRDQYQVSINGEVRQPGSYAYADSMKVEDLVFNAGGFTPGASTMRLEVARRTNNADPTITSLVKVFTISAARQLKPDENNFVLHPFDIVSVFSLPGYEKQRLVKVEGEVGYPGIYAIQSRDEKISDLVKRAGGLTRLADITGATLRRDNTTGLERSKTDSSALLRERREQFSRLNQSDSSAVRILRNNYVGIDLKEILTKPGSTGDLLLENDDILRIPKNEEIVRVNGEVLFPSAVVYDSRKSLSDYIDNAGSYSATAWPKRTYVVYPNGTVRSTHKFLFFRSFPRVRPGSEIFVPRKPVRIHNTMQEIFGITGGLASIGAIILGIISLSK